MNAMNVDQPAKTCPACGADLSAGTAAMPGVCPACGRDLKLEAIVANLPRTETELKKPPFSWSECLALASLLSGVCIVAMGIVVMESQTFHSTGGFLAFLILVLGTPNMFLGLFTAGYFTRSRKAQLLWGIVLSLLFAIVNVGLVFVGCSRMRF